MTLSRARDPGTVDELVATLRRSSIPTLVVEGSYDVIVYRRLEEAFAQVGLSVFPAGGRLQVLALFERMTEFNHNKRVAFIADKDAWVVTGVPSSYEDMQLVLTSGYSIENDLISDLDPLRLMFRDERSAFASELEIFLRWYALAFHRFISNQTTSYKDHPSKVLAVAGQSFLEPGETYPEVMHQLLKDNYVLFIRGKSLLALFLRQLSHSRRAVKYSSLSLLEMSAALEGPLFVNIRERVDRALK